MENKPKKRKIRVKKRVILTEEVKEFILEKMHEGMDISNISKKYPDKVPTADNIYKASLKDKDFENRVNDAYSVLLMRRLDELNDLMDENWCKDRLGQFDGDYKLAFEARRAKLDVLKFILGKMSPILSRRFQKQERLEVTGLEGAASISIINYYADKEPVNIIESKKQELEEH